MDVEAWFLCEYGWHHYSGNGLQVIPSDRETIALARWARLHRTLKNQRGGDLGLEQGRPLHQRYWHVGRLQGLS
jgi:hypothetical protein